MNPVLLKALASAVLCAFAAQSLAAGANQVESEDLHFKHSLYDYHRGDYERARLNLALAEKRHPISAKFEHRRLLEGKIALDQQRFEDAQFIFDSLGVGAETAALSKKMLLPLAKLNFARGQCDKALQAMSQLGEQAEQEIFRTLFMRVSCSLDKENITAEDLGRAEFDVDTLIEDNPKKARDSIWLAYTYYNLAAAAGKSNDFANADRFFMEALKYTGADEEGKALSDRIRLSLAYANFQSNRFDFALKAFEGLRLEGLWIDQSLLGFGWSAYNNYKPGVALEAWRQLINLPFKSLQVYEGYIAIPFALEKVNAFSDALKGYERAIKEYDEVVDQIDHLSSSLTLTSIRQHALEYAQSKGRRIEPLHPLLVSTYAQESFRVAIERIGTIAVLQNQLDADQKALGVFAEAQQERKKIQDSIAAQSLETHKKLKARIEAVEDQLRQVSLSVLKSAYQTSNVSPALRKSYNEYIRLHNVAQGGASNAQIKARLDRLRGALLWAVHEDDASVLRNNKKATAAADAYHRMAIKYAGYVISERANYAPLITEKDVKALDQDIAEVKQQSQLILRAAEQQLLSRTLAVLDGQRKTIENYKRQARIANSRLKEEFFQRGGRQLWR